MTNQNGLEWKNKPSHATVPLSSVKSESSDQCCIIEYLAVWNSTKPFITTLLTYGTLQTVEGY